MKKVVIYPGRFQPMLGHHASVYQKLVNEYPDAEVYITTSDKVEADRSPFNFKEKQLIASGHGIDPKKVLQVRRNYHPEDLEPYIQDPDNTAVYFAVGQKDMEEDPRFKFSDIDEKTGLSLKQNGEPYYFQMINSIKKEPKPMMDRGYIIVVPNEKGDVENGILSASAFRKAIADAPDKNAAKEVFTKYFKNYNEPVFELVYKKIVGDKMSEDLNILRQLAGLNVKEAAPVEFDSPIKPSDIEFAPVSKSSAMMSIANRFPEDKKINDPEDKKDVFVDALMKSPANLLSEINERIMPDENGLEVSKKLSEIIDGMRDGGMADLEKEDRSFALEIVKKAIQEMDLEAGDDREFDPEDQELGNESVDLNDIRSDYGIQEQALKSGPGGLLVYSDGTPLSYGQWKSEWYSETRGMEKATEQELEGKYQKYLNYIQKNSPATAMEGGNAFDIAMTDAEAGIMDCKNDDECLEMLNAMKYNNSDDADEMMADDVIQSYIDMIEKFGLEKIQGKIESEMNEPEPMEGLNELVDPDKLPDEEKEKMDMKGDDKELDQTSSRLAKLNKDLGGGSRSSDRIDKALDVGDQSGNIRPIDQEMIKPYIKKLKMFSYQGMEQYAEQLKNLIDRAEKAYANLGGPAMAEESFDVSGEQSREDQAYDEIMDAYQEGGEEAMCKAIGCSIEELDDEINEIGREKGLHADDDRDEIIQIYVEELVDNADWKDHGEMDVDPEDLDVEEAITDTSSKALDSAMDELRKLAGLDSVDEGGCNSNKKKKK
tara:strand:+ start:278 stop:2587 length:2310 start_codon:yes stop_codon:yes gene_type:complete